MKLEDEIETSRFKAFRDILRFAEKLEEKDEKPEEHLEEKLHPCSFNVEEMDEYDEITKQFEQQEIMSWLDK